MFSKYVKKKRLQCSCTLFVRKNQIRNLSLKYHDEYIELSGSISYGIDIKEYDDFDFIKLME